METIKKDIHGHDLVVGHVYEVTNSLAGYRKIFTLDAIKHVNGEDVLEMSEIGTGAYMFFAGKTLFDLAPVMVEPKAETVNKQIWRANILTKDPAEVKAERVKILKDLLILGIVLFSGYMLYHAIGSILVVKELNHYLNK